MPAKRSSIGLTDSNRQQLVPGLIGMGARTNAVYHVEMHEHGDELLQAPISFCSILVTPDFSATVKAISAGDVELAASLIEDSAWRAADAGADFIVITSNTGSTFAERVAERCGRAVLGIADVVSARAKAAGFRKVGLIGTLHTGRSGMYQRAGADQGVEFFNLPDDLAKDIDVRILHEFARGRTTAEGRALVIRTVEWFAGAGGDAVVLACTDLTLLNLIDERTAIPVLDSTILHARGAAELAVHGPR